jgi:hypothetical protein
VRFSQCLKSRRAWDSRETFVGALAADSRVRAGTLRRKAQHLPAAISSKRPSFELHLLSQSYAQLPFKNLESARCRSARLFHYSLIGKADQQRCDCSFRGFFEANPYYTLREVEFTVVQKRHHNRFRAAFRHLSTRFAQWRVLNRQKKGDFSIPCVCCATFVRL